MTGIDQTLARVRSLQRQIAPAHEQLAGFDSVLARHTDEPSVSEPSSSLLGSFTPVQTHDAITLGRLLNPSPVPAQPPGNSINGIMRADDLQLYLARHDVTARNGHLDRAELAAVDGGWTGHVQLLRPAAQAWSDMRRAAATDGIDLRAVDSYRDWATQDRAHQEYLAGRKPANVLPPGHSEHGNGLAVDVTNGSIVGRDDPEWQWLEAHARDFGWYPISNETWHWEFRGLGA